MKKIVSLLGVLALTFTLFFSVGIQTANADPEPGKTQSYDPEPGKTQSYDPEPGKTQAMDPEAGKTQLV